eukprot:SAG31_NODE_32968_length_349_cov_1.228000_1_plen_66_part_10
MIGLDWSMHTHYLMIGKPFRWTSIALDTGSATMVDGKPVLMWPGVHNASSIPGDKEMRQAGNWRQG